MVANPETGGYNRVIDSNVMQKYAKTGGLLQPPKVFRLQV